VKLETGVDLVILSALASSKYQWPPEKRAYFDGPILSWRELAELFDGDQILRRARPSTIRVPGATVASTTRAGT